MNNHCAYCYGKFGLVRHRRGFKSFCSQKCADQHRIWLQAEVRKRKGWLDCIWSASSNVVPYANEIACLAVASPGEASRPAHVEPLLGS
jgi:hypothetical protein